MDRKPEALTSNHRLGRFLCRIGLHRWRSLGCGPLMMTEDLQCKRCCVFGFRYNG